MRKSPSRQRVLIVGCPPGPTGCTNIKYLTISIDSFKPKETSAFPSAARLFYTGKGNQENIENIKGCTGRI
jgi:hypothetical protein